MFYALHKHKYPVTWLYQLSTYRKPWVKVPQVLWYSRPRGIIITFQSSSFVLKNRGLGAFTFLWRLLFFSPTRSLFSKTASAFLRFMAKGQNVVFFLTATVCSGRLSGCVTCNFKRLQWNRNYYNFNATNKNKSTHHVFPFVCPYLMLLQLVSYLP